MTEIPSILELAKVPPAQRVVVLPCGKAVRLRVLLNAWRKLKSLPPNTSVPGWEWYPVTAAEVLHELSRAVLDRINLRSKARMSWRDNSRRIEATRRARVQCFCRWCGSPLPSYQPQHARFCDKSCASSYCM